MHIYDELVLSVIHLLSHQKHNIQIYITSQPVSKFYCIEFVYLIFADAIALVLIMFDSVTFQIFFFYKILVYVILNTRREFHYYFSGSILLFYPDIINLVNNFSIFCMSFSILLFLTSFPFSYTNAICNQFLYRFIPIYLIIVIIILFLEYTLTSDLDLPNLSTYSQFILTFLQQGRFSVTLQFYF